MERGRRERYRGFHQRAPPKFQQTSDFLEAHPLSGALPINVSENDGNSQVSMNYLRFLLSWLLELLVSNELFLHQQVVLNALQLQGFQFAASMGCDWRKVEREKSTENPTCGQLLGKFDFSSLRLRLLLRLFGVLLFGKLLLLLFVFSLRRVLGQDEDQHRERMRRKETSDRNEEERREGGFKRPSHDGANMRTRNRNRSREEANLVGLLVSHLRAHKGEQPMMLHESNPTSVSGPLGWLA